MDNNKIPDSKWLASMVVAAYSEQRYELGLALARLQSQAVRMEHNATPLVLAVPACCIDCVGRCNGYCSLCHNKRPDVVDPTVYEPEHPSRGWQPDGTIGLLNTEREQAYSNQHADDEGAMEAGEVVDVCHFIADHGPCGRPIRWSVRHQQWSHLNDAGLVVTSPLPAHYGVPTPATNESNAPTPAPAVEEAPTLVTPSARCVALVGDEGGQRECHGVLYWAENGLTEGWVHLDGYQGHRDHDPVADRPVQR